jgi:hypothetical protein
LFVGTDLDAEAARTATGGPTSAATTLAGGTAVAAAPAVAAEVAAPRGRPAAAETDRLGRAGTRRTHRRCHCRSGVEDS